MNELINQTQADLMRLSILECRSCPVRQEARLPVPFVSPAHRASIMLVGRNPGQTENDTGLPFVGRSGQLLNQTLGMFGIDRNKLIVTNVLKCFTTKNREPKLDEYAECYRQHLLREFDFFRPVLVVTFGRGAFRQITDLSVTKTRQRFFSLRGRFTVAAMLHPSAIRDSSRMEMWLSDWIWLTNQPEWISLQDHAR